MFSCIFSLFLKIPLMTSHIVYAVNTLPSPFLVAVSSPRPIPLMLLTGLSWSPKLLCLSALCNWVWPPPGSLVSFVFLFSPQWGFHVFDGSSIYAPVALGSSSEAPLISLNTFMLGFDYLVHHLAALVALFSNLTSSTYSKQEDLSPLEQDLFGQILEPVWHHFDAASTADTPGSTLQRQQGAELLCMLSLGLHCLLHKTWLPVRDRDQFNPRHMSCETRLYIVCLMKQDNTLCLWTHFSHAQHLLRWHMI